jgi:Ca-activated chloride channel homolog
MSLVAIVAGPIAESEAQSVQVPVSERPVYRSGVDLVTVTAVVRDRKGRPIADLQREDFELFESGRLRQITDFRHNDGPISVALLVDVSGSMHVGSNNAAARATVDMVVGWLEPGRDHAALYTFDTGLRESRPFTSDFSGFGESLAGVAAFGQTSLHDAIAETAGRVAARGGSQRAVVVLTDGIDTSSRLAAPEVSGIASSIDVPVYIIVVVSPIDHAARGRETEEAPVGTLSDLARWTGGELIIASAPAHASVAVRRVLGELRHQYLLAFEPSEEPGWHPLELRARGRNVNVRARSGYFASRPGTTDQY